jgi:hypothetical protein
LESIGGVNSAVGKPKGGWSIPKGADLTPEIVLQADDIVFSKVSSPLDLDENQGTLSYILDAMGDACWNINCFAFRKKDFKRRRESLALFPEHHPVLGSVFVHLITQALARQDFDAFHFIGGCLIENRKTAPRTLVKSRDWSSEVAIGKDFTPAFA